ncbi:inositol monophosphatase 1-like [Hydractinia symbiolongicarpus]|uniref:inositol monophosphatase 1-like n=1 Tax=Hydractinia symbiolongicarpus TaxID=13093 RepID=UPI00254A561E|nr:inositol monophosphatase 1-like [Hydractinia symbiolongicarpus]
MASDEVLQHLSSKNDERLRYLLTAINTAKCAGKIVEENYYKVKSYAGKGDITDLVTETDEAVEKFIFDSLRKEFPTHHFIGEESVSSGNSAKLTTEPTWIVDPIDGTANFIHRFPYVAVSIALVINKKPEVGLVYAPILKDFYVAVRGEGAYLNGERLRIENPVSSLATAVVATEWGANRDPERVRQVGKNFIDVVTEHGIHAIRSTGSAALNACLVSCGSVDLYFEFGPHCWDVAAGCLVVEEAGGCNATTKGEEFDLMGRTFIFASSKKLIGELVPTLTQIPTPRDD